MNYIVGTFANIIAASGPDLSEAISPVYDIISTIIPIMLGLVFAIATPYCIVIGVKMAKADDPQTREESKTKLKQSLLGFGLTFVLIVVMWLIKQPLMEWISEVTGGGINV